MALERQREPNEHIVKVDWVEKGVLRVDTYSMALERLSVSASQSRIDHRQLASQHVMYNCFLSLPSAFPPVRRFNASQLSKSLEAERLGAFKMSLLLQARAALIYEYALWTPYSR